MKNRGFTLIELMITVAILAILVGIALPSYQNQVQKTRRADAITTLLQAAQTMERCFTRNNTYVGCTIPNTSADGFYQIGFADGEPTAVSFELTATAPETSSQARDEKCKKFTIDQLGRRRSSPNTEICWGS